MNAARRTPGASSAAIRAHYDAGDAFFALFLDPSLAYSCALFTADDDTLETAQRAKLDWHLDQAGVTPGARLLDIGCGWGGLMERAVWNRNVASAVGLTLSATQAAHITASAPPRVEVRLESWADHHPAARYNAITSIGAFEHFAQTGIGVAGRIQAYRVFFDACGGWLAPGGRLSLQTIAYPAHFDRAAYDASDYGAFVRSRIFPQSDLPELSEILEASHDTFEAEVIRNDRRHYATTTRHWLASLRARRDDAVTLVGAQRVADMERYFRISIGAFDLGNLHLLRIGFRKRPDARRAS